MVSQLCIILKWWCTKPMETHWVLHYSKVHVAIIMTMIWQLLELRQERQLKDLYGKAQKLLDSQNVWGQGLGVPLQILYLGLRAVESVSLEGRMRRGCAPQHGFIPAPTTPATNRPRCWTRCRPYIPKAKASATRQNKRAKAKAKSAPDGAAKAAPKASKAKPKK